MDSIIARSRSLMPLRYSLVEFADGPFVIESKHLIVLSGDELAPGVTVSCNQFSDGLMYEGKIKFMSNSCGDLEGSKKMLQNQVRKSFNFCPQST